MKSNHVKRSILIVVLCVLATLASLAYVLKQSSNQTYTNKDYGFKIDLMKDQFSVQQIDDGHGAEILFVDKEIQERYPEWGGTVFTIFVYEKSSTQENPFDILDAPKYLGENELYYYGAWMPTDVNYPPNESDIVEHYKELSRYAQEHALKSFTLLSS